MRPVKAFAFPRRRLGAVLAVTLGVAGCATATGTNRVIPVVPGFPLEPSVVQVEPGDRLTWVNGDESRGAFRLEFERAPGGPEVSSTSAGYTARFGAPGTYTYTINAATRTGVPLLARSGQVVVQERAGAAPPPAPLPPALDLPPAGAKPTLADDAPLGVGISRVTGGADVFAAYRYRPEQGIVLKVERGTAEPSRLRPGAEVNLLVTYTILAPRDTKPLKVRELRTVRYGNQDLRRLEKDVTVSAGTYSSEHRLTIPADAAEGSYSVTTLVEIPSATQARDEVSSAFSVIAP
jgi:plastocyanin